MSSLPFGLAGGKPLCVPSTRGMAKSPKAIRAYIGDGDERETGRPSAGAHTNGRSEMTKAGLAAVPPAWRAKSEDALKGQDDHAGQGDEQDHFRLQEVHLLPLEPHVLQRLCGVPVQTSCRSVVPPARSEIALRNPGPGPVADR